MEKKWWMDDKFLIITSVNEHGDVTGAEPDIHKIVAEAERRGREAALDAVMRALEEQNKTGYAKTTDLSMCCESCYSTPINEAIEVIKKIDAKINELKGV